MSTLFSAVRPLQEELSRTSSKGLPLVGLGRREMQQRPWLSLSIFSKVDPSAPFLRCYLEKTLKQIQNK